MIRGHKLEPRAWEPEHIDEVLGEVGRNFSGYFGSFAGQPLDSAFAKSVADYVKERQAYGDYLDLETLADYDQDDPGAFKTFTMKQCPIIRRCLNSRDEVMDDYKKSFGIASGRQILDAVRCIARFGAKYELGFDDATHEATTAYADLGLDPLNEQQYGLGGVIGYGIQSAMLYGIHPRCFANRSQNAVWSLYFLTGRKDFGFRDGSEFLMVEADQGTCEQNYFFPADLFGFYALKLFLLLKGACATRGISLADEHRYCYLNAFCDHVADRNREAINVLSRSSERVENQPWF